MPKCKKKNQNAPPLCPSEDEYCCPICTSLKVGAHKLGCDHGFCGDCLLDLSNSNAARACPVCRAPITGATPDPRADDAIRAIVSADEGPTGEVHRARQRDWRSNVDRRHVRARLLAWMSTPQQNAATLPRFSMRLIGMQTPCAHPNHGRGLVISTLDSENPTALPQTRWRYQVCERCSTTITIGRHGRAVTPLSRHIAISDPNLSRAHASITFDGENWSIGAIEGATSLPRNGIRLVRIREGALESTHLDLSSRHVINNRSAFAFSRNTCIGVHIRSAPVFAAAV